MTSRLPSVIKKLVVTTVTQNFRDAVKLVSVPINEATLPLGPKDVLVKNRFVGINASDINYTSGRYDASLKPPFDCGFEGLGEVVACGDQVRTMKVGQPVAYLKFGAFAEYTVVEEKVAMPVPAVKAEYVPLTLSGLTAALALDKVGEIKAGEKVLVTAAAGGTGQFAVQYAKNTGCHVIGTCSTDEKVEFLKSLGCDRVINYKKENLKAVLKKEYPKGIDVIYESVGGEVFDTCIHNLAVKGRLIVIGFISGYENQMGFSPLRTTAIPVLLLTSSSSLRGFFLFHYVKYIPEYLAKLVQLVQDGKIRSVVDTGEKTPNGPFRGVESIVEAVEYLYSQKSIGKIVVEFPADLKSNL